MSVSTDLTFTPISSCDGFAQFAGRVVAYKTPEGDSEEYTIEDIHFGYINHSHGWSSGSHMRMSTLMKVHKVATDPVSEATKENHPLMDSEPSLENSTIWRETKPAMPKAQDRSSWFQNREPFFEFKPGMSMRLATREEVHVVRTAIWSGRATFTDEYCIKEKINRILDDHILKLAGCR